MCIRDRVYSHQINPGIFSFNILDGCYHSYFIIKGEISYSSSIYKKGTFFIVDNIKEFNLEVDDKTEIFEIISPLEPTYKTYAQTHSIN